MSAVEFTQDGSTPVVVNRMIPNSDAFEADIDSRIRLADICGNVLPLPQPPQQPHFVLPQPQPLRHHLPRGKEKRKRDRNWTTGETALLVECKYQSFLWPQGHFCKEKANVTNWDAIAEEIKNKLGSNPEFAKTGDQCRLRWDTLVKSYQRVRECCKDLNKKVSELTDKEKGALRLATKLEDRWYEVIDQCSGKGRSQKHVSTKRESSQRQRVIPEFTALDGNLKSTLLNLILGGVIFLSIMEDWNHEAFTMEEVCRWLAIVQNRSSSRTLYDLHGLLELKLLSVELVDFQVRLRYSELRAYKKFAKKVVRKIPHYDTQLHRIRGSDMAFFESSLFPKRITVLTLIGCEKLVKAHLDGLPKLRSLVFKRCYILEEVSGWEGLKDLGWLEFGHCPLYRRGYPDVHCMPSLRECRLNKSSWQSLGTEDTYQTMYKLVDFSRCVRLRILKVVMDLCLENTGDLSTLKCLEALSFKLCRNLQILDLGGMHSLTRLDLGGCMAIRCLPYLGHMKVLAELDISDSGIEDILSLEKVDSLNTLKLRLCKAIQRLPNLGHMKDLVHLDIAGTSVEEIPGIQTLEGLVTVDCEGSSLRSLPELSSLSRLRSVNLTSTPVAMDPSSIYHEKEVVTFNEEVVERTQFVKCVMEYPQAQGTSDGDDLSDTEYKHSDEEFRGDVHWDSGSGSACGDSDGSSSRYGRSRRSNPMPGATRPNGCDYHLWRELHSAFTEVDFWEANRKIANPNEGMEILSLW